VNNTFLSIKVSETEQDVGFWASRDYVPSELGDKLRQADVLVLPWEEFRQDEPILFPSGTGDVYRALVEAFGEQVVIAATKEAYKEIALHANVTRWPTLLVKAAVLPVLLGILANEIDTAAFHHDQNVEVKIVIATQGQACVQIEYKGPANDAVKTLSENAAKFCPQPATAPRHTHPKPHH
jgi:hypothetical protein